MATINENILKTNFGFNDPNVIKGILSDAGKVAQYQREYDNMGLSSTGSSSSTGNGSMDYSSLVSQNLEIQKKANEPQVQALTASKTSISDRYKALIDEIKGTQKTETESATTRTANELGRRGILPSSGFGERELGAATEQVSRFYTPKVAEAAAGESQDLASVDQLIAQLKSGDVSTAASAALQILNLEQQQRALESKNASTTADTEVITANGRKLLINKRTGAIIQDLGKADSSGSPGIDPAILQLLLGGGTPTQVETTKTPATVTGAMAGVTAGRPALSTFYK